jgi:hypothetical protein
MNQRSIELLALCLNVSAKFAQTEELDVASVYAVWTASIS